MNAALLGLVASAVLGWADVTVSPSKGDRAVGALHSSILTMDRPGERTVETLKRYDFENRYRRDPDAVIAQLKKLARTEPSAEIVYAVAELAWIEGRHAEIRRIGRRAKNPIDYYVLTVSYAFDFLFDPELATGRNPTDPRYLLACGLYNGSLERILRAARGKEPMQPGGSIRLKLVSGEQVYRLALEEHSAWKAEDVHDLLLASDFEVSGLDSRSKQYGMGVPLVAVRKAELSNSEQAKALDKYYPPEMAFPLTAVWRPEKRLREIDDTEAIRECTIDLVDPVLYQTVGKEAGSVGLETDLTTPLAYMWSRQDLTRLRWNGLFRPGSTQDRTGLMLMRPYDPDKIPVVMVHGLASSPLAWIPMLNELLRDPKIHDRYQFLLYLYPTGMPIPVASSGLRDALLDAQVHFDQPGDRTPDHEFRRMILLGHSMGGILSNAMVVSSGDKFWDLATDKDFSEMNGPPEVLSELKHFCFFEPLPFVHRVVFLAVPHRGADLAHLLFGRMVSRQIAEPDSLLKLFGALVKDNPDAFNAKKFKRLPTSIDELITDSKVLLALLAMKPADGVIFNSIIGSRSPDSKLDTTDGVVSYRSAHFEPVESEKIVRSGHHVQEDSAAILEVRRILLKHLEQEGVATAPGLEPR